MNASTKNGQKRAVPFKWVAIGIAVVALLLAGVVSYYASADPDGLEYVAGKTGFLDSASNHGAADGPLADYSAKGVDNSRLSGGLAGVIGTVVVLVGAGGLALVVRRRSSSSSSSGE
ncbi:cobalt/nickel transport protein [Nocardioides albertanoniae]|uniref:Cobalt/nickel transport protein n=1 Tax=Nocardioides albertanoniae TaxID=1175486 RepID=A0A543ACQ2_9ACTN|nr:PDGLE domain-containing protein [Nocardioides albertanoniae]TQL70354.1 cobalt/nickel transport protein [Nocardioides albertanoniae]